MNSALLDVLFARRSVAILLLVVTGCDRAELPQWSLSKQTSELPEALREKVAEQLDKHAGTSLAPKVMTEGEPNFRETLHLKRGQVVYRKRCVQCHGENGDGNGPVAVSMYPRPRDYTRGIFKFTTTEYGARPRREDLIATVRRGITGTSMPAFNLLPPGDLEAVVDYVRVLSQRGEFEFQLGSEAQAMEELEDDAVPDLVSTVTSRWTAAESGLTQPLSPQPSLTDEQIRLGREAFLTKGCSKCHGEDGRGQMPDNIGRDAWGFSTRAADLTSGMLRGGREPIDVYRRILNGINGTPMPGFRSSLQSEPDTIWNLVAYVLHVSNRRRDGEAVPAGLIKPFNDPPPETALPVAE